MTTRKKTTRTNRTTRTQTVTKDAMVLFRSYTESFTAARVTKLCENIMSAHGDRATAIYCAVRNGWWDRKVAEPCKAILESEGDVAKAVYEAKEAGWWEDSVANPRHVIERKCDIFDRNILIRAIMSDWWGEKYPLELLYNSYSPSFSSEDTYLLCEAIYKSKDDGRYRIIAAAKNYGWWDDSVANPCQAIVEDYNTPLSFLNQVSAEWWWDASNIDPETMVKFRDRVNTSVSYTNGNPKVNLMRMFSSYNYNITRAFVNKNSPDTSEPVEMFVCKSCKHSDRSDLPSGVLVIKCDQCGGEKHRANRSDIADLVLKIDSDSLKRIVNIIMPPNLTTLKDLPIKTMEEIEAEGDKLVKLRRDLIFVFDAEGREYEIEISRITDTRDIIDWLYHLLQKGWFTKDHAERFIEVACRVIGTTPYGNA